MAVPPRVPGRNAFPGTASSGGFRASFAKVTRTTNQSIANNTHVQVNFTTEVEDPDGAFNIGTSDSRLYCTIAGVYIVGGDLIWAEETDTNQRSILIRKNGSDIIGGMTERNLGGGSSPRITGTGFARFTTAGDYVDLDAFHTAGSTTEIEGGSLWWARVGD